MGIDELRAVDTGAGSVAAEREQWDDGNNTLALAPGTVVAYERNTTTNAHLAAAGIEVLTIAGFELDPVAVARGACPVPGRVTPSGDHTLRSAQPPVHPATGRSPRLRRCATAPTVMIVLKKAEKRRPASPLRRLSGQDWAAMAPTWRDAKVGIIDAALARPRARPSGNWFVAGASRDVRTGSPVGTTVGDVEVVLWRTADGRVHAGPGACPHLARPWTTAAVQRQHCAAAGTGWRSARRARGLAPVSRPRRRRARLGPRSTRSAARSPPRPRRARAPAAGPVLGRGDRRAGPVRARDVIANRLDPWHGSWLHPYAFSHLRVDDAASTDRPARRRRRLPARAHLGRAGARRLLLPGRADDVMQITEGEGAGSVVETHATPLGADEHGAPVTQVTEATIAYSDRAGFARRPPWRR